MSSCWLTCSIFTSFWTLIKLYKYLVDYTGNQKSDGWLSTYIVLCLKFGQMDCSIYFSLIHLSIVKHFNIWSISLVFRLTKKAPFRLFPLSFPLFWFDLASVHIVWSMPSSPPEVTETKAEADGRDTNEPLSARLKSVQHKGQSVNMSHWHVTSSDRAGWMVGETVGCRPG